MDFNIKHKQSNNEDDAYMREIRDKMKIKKSNGIMEDRKMDIYYQDSGETNDGWINYRLKHTVSFWASAFIAVATGKTVYKPSVKIIHKYLGLQGFLNINMAATPFIMISVALTCGTFQGLWNVWQLEQELQNYKQ